nr:CPm [Carrot closterovirus 2]
MPGDNDDGVSNKSEVTKAALDSFLVTDERLLTGVDKMTAKNKFLKALSTKNAALKLADGDMHLGAALYGYAIRTTSKKASNEDIGFLNYTVGGIVFNFTETDYKSAINTVSEISGFNKVRIFCRSFSQEYLNFARAHADKLPRNPRAGSLGIPQRFEYLACDFVVGTEGLSEEEHACFVKARDRALSKPLENGNQFVASVYELGRH